MPRNAGGKTGKGAARADSGRRRRPLLLGAVAILVSAGVALGLWLGGPDRSAHAYVLAPESALDSRVRRAPTKVREAYRFAIANRALLNQIPCFCGCWEEDGHRGNADCYVEDIRPDGSVVFDYMSLG